MANASDDKATKVKRPWRDNLEAFGVAILAAVLLKPMIIEAYQIPTSSMQPTLMGSTEAGVYDRILVDKLRYTLCEPRRWDIVVFRYPIRRSQNYVKRIAGMPGDRLRIAGGNLWHVGTDGQVDHVLRKPDHVQKGQWKELYPARRRLDDPNGKVLGSYFAGDGGVWTEDGADLVVKSSGRARLAFTDLGHRGAADHVWDGYAPDVAAAIRSKSGAGGTRGVQDLRISFALMPKAVPATLAVELGLTPPGHASRAYRLELEAGRARLRILATEGRDKKEVAASAPVACELTAGAATEIGFAHVDDRLIAYRGDAEIAALEVGAARVLQDLEPQHVMLSVEVQGGDELRLRDLVVARDLHYVANGLEDDLAKLVPAELPRTLANHVIQVPPGHYLMLGDNTLASADSRQWQTVSVGADASGWMVDPGRAETDATLVVHTGNMRPWDLTSRPDTDENPVFVRGRNGQPDQVAFTDANGETVALQTRLSPNYAPARDAMRFRGPTGSEEWAARAEHVYFVPREHILGRPVLGFWPVVPFRLGFIR